MNLMSLKDKILDEILEDLDQHEGSKLKQVTVSDDASAKPALGISMDDDKSKLGMASALGDDEEGEGEGDGNDDDELKQLLEHYLSQK